ncbi:IucA/IucC family protein [Nonomuraea typhae]|uniref:IucA/IucC family protein n=1 Tax=Nonomuraea typhae TaxID=2603600 RepID=A0ABW7YXQ2_9ACTN
MTPSPVEARLAARVLDALLREDYGGLSRRVSRTREGVRLTLAGGMDVRLVPGVLYQDFVVAPEERLRLAQVLGTLAEIADPADADGVTAFAGECAAALAAGELHAAHAERVLAAGPSYETLAAFVEHPVYPTSRARVGMGAADLLAYAPEFGPAFALRWVAVPGYDEPFPVHPLTLAEALKADGVREVEGPETIVRPTLSMRTVELDARTHLKLPLPISTLGVRNRRSIKPGTLRDGALAELLVRELADPDILVADEQSWAHAGHEYLAWMIRRLPAGTIVPVAALTAPTVLSGLGDVIPEYLRILLRWNVRLFVRHGVALEAHQQNLALVFTASGMKLLVKDNDGLLASPSRLRAAGLEVPDFTDERMLTDDPHALADVFVTITLHLAAAAVAFGALPHERAALLLRDTLADALDEHGDDPMARLLRARTLDAARLTGKSMIIAGTLVAKERTGARDVNKYYGASGPNYLRRA